MDTIRSEHPLRGISTRRAATETSVDYQNRQAEMDQAALQFARNWRRFSIFPPPEDPGSTNALTSFISNHQAELSLGWECKVYDVRRYQSVGREILCSVFSVDDWDYAVMGILDEEVKRGTLIRFKPFNSAIPVEDDPFKLRFFWRDRYREPLHIQIERPELQGRSPKAR